MQRVSSNLTLFLRFFIPTFWIVFFGAFTVLIFSYDLEYVAQIPITTFRIIAVLFMLSGIALFYFTLFQLKRVEMDDKFAFVTDYFKHVRYPYHNIEKIEESKFAFLKVATIHLKTPGSFGKTVRFVASGKKYKEFWEKHPDLSSLRES